MQNQDDVQCKYPFSKILQIRKKTSFLRQIGVQMDFVSSILPFAPGIRSILTGFDINIVNRWHLHQSTNKEIRKFTIHNNRTDHTEKQGHYYKNRSQI